MKLKKVGLGIICGVSALTLLACGDDVMYIENGDSFTTVESLKDADCTKDNEGAMVFVKKEANMYACTDSEWVAISASESIDYRCSAKNLKDSSGYTIICDGDTIGVVKNKTESSKVNVDSLYKAIMKNISVENSCHIDSSKSKSSKATKYTVVCDGDTIGSINADQNTDDLTCRIDSTWIDSTKKVQAVTIACGKGKKTLELPISIESANLSNIYKKTVIARMPLAIGRDGNATRQQSGNMYFEELWQQMNASVVGQAELVVMELDSNYNATGKNFVSNLTLMPKENLLRIYDNNTSDQQEFWIYMLTGNIDVTNMISSRTQIRVTSLISFEGKPSFMTYNAVVDLDDADTIVVDFLTDYKAARTKTLIEKGKTFKKASAQANSELAEIFGLDKDFESFETYLPDSYERNEFLAISTWPAFVAAFMAKSQAEYVYPVFKDIFAKNGNFDKAIKLSENGVDTTLFFVDFFVLAARGDEGSDLMKYKFIQNGLKSAYKLPSCDLSQAQYYVSKVGEGMLNLFECYGKEENWFPADFTEIDKSLLLGECNEMNLGTHVITIGGRRYASECILFDDVEYMWDVEEADWCKGLKNGDYFISSETYEYDMRKYNVYYRCVENKDTKDIEAVEVDSVEFFLQKPCDEESVMDSLYAIKENFFVCTESGYQKVNYDAYGNFNGYDAHTLATIQVGECNESRYGKVFPINQTPVKKANVLCGKNYRGSYEWTFGYDKRIDLFGMCDEAKEKLHKVYKYNECELFERSTTTCIAYAKCATNARDSYESYDWAYADEDDVKLDTACVHSMVGEIVHNDENGEDYICTEDIVMSSSSYSWEVYDVEARCNAELDVESCEEAASECFMYNSYYACSSVSKKWEISVDYNKWCTEKHGACNYKNYSNGIDDCVDFPFMGYYITCMCDDGEEGDCYWSDQR